MCKGINRGIATFSAGGLGLAANYIASHLGKEGEPVFLGFLVFLLGIYSLFIMSDQLYHILSISK